MRERMWSFETRNFLVVASIEPSAHVDCSFDETGETAAKIDSGEWCAFDTFVTVYCRGQVVGQDVLCESIYADPREFFTAHRDADPMNRNCTIMRAKNGDNVSICHYFPGMVVDAVRQARDNVWQLGRIKVRV